MKSAVEMTSIVAEMIPIAAAMGIRVTVSERGRAEAVLPSGPNGNHLGTTYAGSLFTVAELLGAVLVDGVEPPAGFAPLIKSMEIKYLRPAIGDVTAIATLDEDVIKQTLDVALERGKADFVVDADIVDVNGTVVASTSGIYQLRRFF